MKHSDKDIESAEEYATDHTGELDYVTKSAFLAGCEHKQEGMYELVEALDYANHTIRMLIASKPMRDVDETLAHQDKLIQKYKR